MPTAETLGEVIVDHQNGKPIRLKDVATVVDGPEIKVGDCVVMGRPGCLMTMSSQYGANTEEVTKALEEVLKREEETFKGFGIDYFGGLHRPASFIEVSIANILHSLYLGGVLVAAGLIMLVLPGPGILVIAVGFAVLGTEYAWAAAALERTKRAAEQAGRVAKAGVSRAARSTWSD